MGTKEEVLKDRSRKAELRERASSRYIRGDLPSRAVSIRQTRAMQSGDYIRAQLIFASPVTIPWRVIVIIHRIINVNHREDKKEESEEWKHIKDDTLKLYLFLY